jgi:hypothetical protein
MMKPPADTAAKADIDNQVAAGFFALDFAALGGATCSGPRSIELRRPAVNV